MSLVWDATLPPMEKLVLLALADCANDEGHCWPSATTLMRKSGQGERTVRRCIQSLIKNGHLTQQIRSGTSSVFTVHPCQSGTPARAAPLPDRPQTPARAAPKPLVTVISSEAKASSPRVKFPAPPGVFDEQWKAFRGQRKKELNARSYTLICNKLLKLAEDGWPPGDMLDLAIERGWETVFAPRTFAHDRTNSNPTAQAVHRILGNC
jgi:hypothetical protein